MLNYFSFIGVKLECEKDFFMSASCSFTSIILKKQTTPTFIEPTELIYDFPEAIFGACSLTGYLFELARKFGGVYNYEYFRNRMLENLLMNKPIIANLSHKNSGGWHLITCYDYENDLIYISDKPIDNWYKYINGMLFFDKEPSYKPTVNILSILREVILKEKSLTLNGFVCGENAYNFWKHNVKSAGAKHSLNENIKKYRKLMKRVVSSRFSLLCLLNRFGEDKYQLTRCYNELNILFEKNEELILSKSHLCETDLIEFINKISYFDNLLNMELQ